MRQAGTIILIWNTPNVQMLKAWYYWEVGPSGRSSGHWRCALAEDRGIPASSFLLLHGHEESSLLYHALLSQCTTALPQA
jgi:hypothetical protein